MKKLLEVVVTILSLWNHDVDHVLHGDHTVVAFERKHNIICR